MKFIDTNPTPPRADIVVGPSERDLARLAGLISAHAPTDGRFELPIPGLQAIRYSRTSTELTHEVSRQVVCIVAKGAKSVMLGQEVYEYDASRMLITSLNLPIASQVTRASRSEPYLCFAMGLAPHRIAELALKIFPQGLPPVQEGRAVFVCHADAKIVNAATRLLELVAEPEDAELLAPLVIDEILIRLLRGPACVLVGQIGLVDSGMHRIVKAVSWLRANFSRPMKIEELARMANMSVSSFHQHFKSVTSMSPLQYQKALRLQEARRIMLSTIMGAGTASRQVGYVSASQFSRDYSRFFGSAPIKDIARLREQGFTAADVSR